jgi:hypothetical protein
VCTVAHQSSLEISRAVYAMNGAPPPYKRARLSHTVITVRDVNANDTNRMKRMKRTNYKL